MKSLRHRWLRGERGESAFNVVNVGFALGVFAAGYFGSVYLPPVFRNAQIERAMKEGAYEAWRMKEDGKLREMIIKDVYERYPPDKTASNPALPRLRVKDIVIKREAGMARISAEYTVTLTFPWTKRTTEVRFRPKAEATLAPPTTEKTAIEQFDWLFK